MRSTCIIQRISSQKATGCEKFLKTLVHFDLLATRSDRVIKSWPLSNKNCWTSQKIRGK